MICGLLLLAFGPKSLFLLSLCLMIVANGFFKSNISSLLGLLYENNEEKKDSAYTIFYMGINLGAFFSPLVCGTLAVKYGYEYGFASAGIGMLIGLTFYKLFENRWIGEYGLKPVGVNSVAEDRNEQTNSAQQNSRLGALLVLMLFTVPFWVCFEQAGSSLTLFAQYLTDRNFFNWEIPTGYFQSLNPLFIILLAPLMSVLWGSLRDKSKEPSSVEKFAIALFLIAVSFVGLAFAGFLSGKGLVAPWWRGAGYFKMTVA